MRRWAIRRLVITLARIAWPLATLGLTVLDMFAKALSRRIEH